LLAVPFVGKDVPSRSSEFAHPDILIGLTILAYRYEGIRRTDVKTIVSQLKHDCSRELGPRAQRPACILFRSWIVEGLARPQTSTQKNSGGVLPLPLFQLNDSSQVTRLLQLIRLLPSVIHYFVCQHVFPSCMNFQTLKVSASGHELGSDHLFAKRIGFSGTPSNLLPMDLGTCYYEPLSDGNIFSVLTSPRVTTLERKLDWNATSLLRDVASSTDPPFHALIDTGALITGLENEEVARFLLEHLPLSMEGVVYMDTSDRQMVLLRGHLASMPLIQCALSLEKRFTFYDQVHTTGMDIKQGTNARAVLTLGKDMTFRDYAQGAYRMRGIGVGQTIHLYLIPEVENRIRQELALCLSDKSTSLSSSSELVHASASACSLRSSLELFRLYIPMWLLVNSMKMESMQLVQLSLQELHNTWRKKALHVLMEEVDQNKKHHTPTQRLLRFHRLSKQTRGCMTSSTTRPPPPPSIIESPTSSSVCIYPQECATAEKHSELQHGHLKETNDLLWLRQCINAYRVQVSYAIANHVPLPRRASDTMAELVETFGSFLQTTDEKKRVALVLERIKNVETSGRQQHHHHGMDLHAEVVHENEAEAEAEAEEEAEQEEQKMSAYSRDDEHPVPWSVDHLRSYDVIHGTKIMAKAAAIENTNHASLSSSSSSSCTTATTASSSSSSCSSFAFHPLSSFQAHASMPSIAFSPHMLFSDNFFRPQWVGLGERRLKNIGFIMEWHPE
jgi:hypothetical protein